MFNFLAQNIGSILIGLAVFSIISLIIVRMVKDSKDGKSVGCGCNCESCHGACHK